ncbi:hypothetical protein QL285_092095 [Trifolium repens]|nr:hypothetical protein QL285_092095 [Trifolium repens]
MLGHPNGNNAFLGLEVTKTKSFINGGKEAALLYGFTEPTEVTVEMELDAEDNDILIQFIDCPNSGENEVMFVSDTPDYCLHPFDKDDVFGWEKTIKTTKPQVAHFPPRTAAGVVRDMKKIKIRTRHYGDNTDATIVSYQRLLGGPVEMYMTKGCSGSDELDDNSFTTTIDPNEEKIWVCPDFLKRWGHKLNFNKHGYIVNGETDQKTFIQLKNDNGEVFISCGMSLAIMNGIRKPTKIELQYECYENNFLMYSINGDDDGSTESDHHADKLLKEICNFARENENLNNQNAQIIEEAQVQQPVLGENQLGHYTWKQTCSLAFAKGQSCLHFPKQVCNNLPFGDNQILEVLNRETNETVFCPVTKSNKAKPEYHLTKPWYQFIKNMQLKEKDRLFFSLDHPPTKLIVSKD